MPTLTQLAEEKRALEDVLFEAGGEISDEQIEATIDQWFAEIGDQIKDKIDGYCYVIDELTRLAKGRREDAARIEGMARTDENNVKRLKARLKFFLEAQKLQKFETPHWKLGIQQNGGKQAITHLKPVEEWPEEYVLTETVKKPNTEKLMAALEAGEKLPFARLEPRGEHLRIR